MDYNNYIKVPNYMIWVGFYVINAVALLILLFAVGSWNGKIEAIFSGFIVACLVGIVQILSDLDLYRKNRRIEKTRIVDVIEKRKDEEKYGGLIRQSKKEVLVLGTTCSRFMKDFVDQSSVVSEAISRGVVFKLLIPEDDFLEQEDRGKIKTITLQIYERMSGDQRKFFSIKRFREFPNHSLVVVDDLYIVGPIFRRLKRSEVTPSIVFRARSSVATAYREYFDQLWEGGRN